jgi:hypothetical protein
MCKALASFIINSKILFVMIRIRINSQRLQNQRNTFFLPGFMVSSVKEANIVRRDKIYFKESA